MVSVAVQKAMFDYLRHQELGPAGRQACEAINGMLQAVRRWVEEGKPLDPHVVEETLFSEIRYAFPDFPLYA